MDASQLIEQDAEQIVSGMVKRNPQLQHHLARENGLTMTEFAVAIITQWKAMHGLRYPTST